MDIKLSSIIFLAFLCSTSTAFNITRILSNYTEFGVFDGLLSKTGLAHQINNRKTITVLAVNDASIGDLAGKSMDVVQKILSNHVILDYYDVDKLKNLKKSTAILTTLYQTSGDANNEQGFLNVTKTDKGVMFGSAVKGSPLVASLQGSVAARPYDISVLKVSAVIEAPGIQNVTAAAPPPSPASPSAQSPANVPSTAPAPHSPFSSPPEPDTAPSNESPAPAPAIKRISASSRNHVGGFTTVMLLAACLVGF